MPVRRRGGTAVKFREVDGVGSDSDTASIFPLLSSEGDRRLLLDWIESHDGYRLVDPGKPVETAEFDCCILDGKALERHAETLRQRKRAVEPVLLPCLLLLPETDLSVLEMDGGEIADNVLFEAVDEVVAMPIKKVELEWRTEALLRLREQSLELDDKRRELRLFRRATEAAGHAVYITDTDGTIEYVNPAFEEMTGYDAGEVIGDTPQVLRSGEMPAEYYEQLWETISGGDVWEEDILNRRDSGELYHAYQTIAPVTDGTGEPTNFVAIQSEITQRVEAEQKLRTFRDIVERIDDPIMLQDRDGQFQLVNEALTEYAEMTREELYGETEYAFMEEASADIIHARKKQVLDQERPVQYSITPTFPTENGETFSTVRYPYYGEDGDLQGTVAICRNVTELELRDHQLQVMDRVLRHNLRNDMTTIGMYAEKLQDAAPAELMADAKRINETTRKVNRMVEKQRKVTKFLTESLGEKPLDLAGIVETVVERQREVHPAAEIRSEFPETCTVHATVAFEEAVVELVENAVVHSDRDRPTVDVRLTVGPESKTITVADDGPGIPEMDRKVLTRGREIEQLYHGSGLGLWLVHLIVTHSGGTVTFSENEPRGSVVTIRLPRR